MHKNDTLIITSRIFLCEGFDIIGEKTIAEAIMDRLVNKAHRIKLESVNGKMRKMVESINFCLFLLASFGNNIKLKIQIWRNQRGYPAQTDVRRIRREARVGYKECEER